MNRELLIVEDDRVTALHLRSRLERLGYAITGVTGFGEEALSFLEHHRPDLVLINIALARDFTGSATAKIIAESGTAITHDSCRSYGPIPHNSPGYFKICLRTPSDTEVRRLR